MLWRRVVAIASAAVMTLGFVGVYSQPAGAQPVGTVAAVIIGSTDIGTPPSTVDFRVDTGTFDGLVIEGSFSADEDIDDTVIPNVCSLAAVDVGTVTFTTNQNLAVGFGTIDAAPAVTSGCPLGTTVTLTLNGGTFVRVGTYANATISVTVTVLRGTVTQTVTVSAICNIGVVIVPGDPTATVAGKCLAGGP